MLMMVWLELKRCLKACLVGKFALVIAKQHPCSLTTALKCPSIARVSRIFPSIRLRSQNLVSGCQ
jgi:hypothetical protein